MKRLQFALSVTVACLLLGAALFSYLSQIRKNASLQITRMGGRVGCVDLFGWPECTVRFDGETKLSDEELDAVVESLNTLSDFSASVSCYWFINVSECEQARAFEKLRIKSLYFDKTLIEAEVMECLSHRLKGGFDVDFIVPSTAKEK